VRVEASTREGSAACPACGVRSGRAHSGYQRRLLDTAVAGRQMLVVLRVRRMFCDNGGCPKVTFAEQVSGLTVRYGRRSPVLTRLLQVVAVALGGRPGARMAARLACAVSRMTLLRLLRSLPLPEPGAIEVLGVDDFAVRRGYRYGTVLVDMATHRVVDVLEDRLAQPFADWLRAHPGVQVVCRDRGGSYAEGARTGAPQAIQVADRFHLLLNLTAAVDRVVRAHRACLQDQPAEQAVAQPVPTDLLQGRRAEATRQRHAEVHALWDKGVGTTAIGNALHLDHKTVLRYARAATPDELLTQPPRRGSRLDAHLEYLAGRWQEGCTNAARLTAEVRERGYRGSERTVRRLLHHWRDGTTPPTATPAAAPKPREVIGWIIRPADQRSEQQQTDLARILERCATLRTVDTLVSDFAGMLRHRRGEHLDTWVIDAQTSGISQLHGFAAGLLKDYDAVRNGLTLSWSSGAVEGAVCKLKALKRAMFGRANFDLLRRRLLLAD
jgi:transposase